MLTSFRWLGDATVTILVGKAKSAFHIHEDILFGESSFFKAAFTSQSQERSKRSMTLPEDDTSIFQLFVDWLYHQRYCMGVLSACDKPPDRYLRHVQLYILADKYDVPRLKGLVLRRIFSLMKPALKSSSLDDKPCLATISYIYEHTSNNAALRKIFIDGLVWSCAYEFLIRASVLEWLRANPDISLDLNIRFAKKRVSQSDPFAGDIPEEYLNDKSESEK